MSFFFHLKTVDTYISQQIVNCTSKSYSRRNYVQNCIKQHCYIIQNNCLKRNTGGLFIDGQGKLFIFHFANKFLQPATCNKLTRLSATLGRGRAIISILCLCRKPRMHRLSMSMGNPIAGNIGCP